MGSRNDRVGVDAVVTIEIGNGAGLAEMLDAERPHPMTADRAEPGERRRMAIEHGDEATMGRLPPRSSAARMDFCGFALTRTTPFLSSSRAASMSSFDAARLKSSALSFLAATSAAPPCNVEVQPARHWSVSGAAKTCLIVQ